MDLKTANRLQQHLQRTVMGRLVAEKVGLSRPGNLKWSGRQPASLTGYRQFLMHWPGCITWPSDPQLLGGRPSPLTPAGLLPRQAAAGTAGRQPRSKERSTTPFTVNWNWKPVWIPVPGSGGRACVCGSSGADRWLAPGWIFLLIPALSALPALGCW